MGTEGIKLNETKFPLKKVMRGEKPGKTWVNATSYIETKYCRKQLSKIWIHQEAVVGTNQKQEFNKLTQKISPSK